MCRFILFSLIAVFNLYVKASDSLYITIDQKGNKVFSDQKPNSGAFETRDLMEVNPVVWIPTNLVKKQKKRLTHSGKNLLRESLETKKQRCSKYTKQIKSFEKQLSQKQKAGQFDLIKNKLRKLRWTYQTKC